jgi:hypothetical protein
MSLKKTKQRFISTGIFLSIFFCLFSFSAKADFSPRCLVYLNDTLLQTLNSGTNNAVLHIPHWKEGDILTFTYSADTGVHGREQFIIRTKNDSTFRVMDLVEKNSFTSQGKISFSEFPHNEYYVFSGTRGFADLTYFVFRIQFDS